MNLGALLVNNLSSIYFVVSVELMKFSIYLNINIKKSYKKKYNSIRFIFIY